MAVRDLVDRVEWVIPLVLELVTARVAAPELVPVVAKLELGPVATGLERGQVAGVPERDRVVAELEHGLVVAKLERGPVAEPPVPNQPHAQLAVPLRIKSATAARRPGQVPLLAAEEDLAAVVAEITHGPAATEAATAWAAAE